jgi:hypothetical protein
MRIWIRIQALPWHRKKICKDLPSLFRSNKNFLALLNSVPDPKIFLLGPIRGSVILNDRSGKPINYGDPDSTSTFFWPLKRIPMLSNRYR